eukprot:805047-Rhodomonas_salina.1
MLVQDWTLDQSGTLGEETASAEPVLKWAYDATRARGTTRADHAPLHTNGAVYNEPSPGALSCYAHSTRCPVLRKRKVQSLWYWFPVLSVYGATGCPVLTKRWLPDSYQRSAAYYRAAATVPDRRDRGSDARAFRGTAASCVVSCCPFLVLTWRMVLPALHP